MKNITRINEITEQSGENSKVYLMSDGSNEMVLYTGETANPLSRSVVQTGSTNIRVYNWKDGTMSQSGEDKVGIEVVDGAKTVNRLYFKLSIPSLPRNPRIKSVELCIPELSRALTSEQMPIISMHLLSEDFAVGEASPAFAAGVSDFEKIKEQGGGTYKFDITRLVNSQGTSNLGFVLKLLNENGTENENITIGSPTVSVNYESNYAINSNYRQHTHSLGFFGQGAVDLACKNLTFEFEDFAWQGNRLPVTVKHLYNSALSDKNYSGISGIRLNAGDFSGMKIGKGFKLSVWESMSGGSFAYNGANTNGYIYVNENGEETYFISKEGSSTEYVCIDDNESVFNWETKTLKMGSDTLVFDSKQRLISKTNENGATQSIVYENEKIVKIIDGANREFTFEYDANGYLIKITAPDETSVTYTYDGDYLKTVTFPDGNCAELSYQNTKPQRVLLKNKDGESVYAVNYTFSGNELIKTQEFGFENGNEIQGVTTVFTDENKPYRMRVTTTQSADTESGEAETTTTVTYYAFDEDGNVVSEYTAVNGENVAVEGSGNGMVPVLQSGAKTRANINNMVSDHSFEKGLCPMGECFGIDSSKFVYSTVNSEKRAKFGKKLLRLENKEENAVNGAYIHVTNMPIGEICASAYVRIVSGFNGENDGVFLRISDSLGQTVLAQSEVISQTFGDYMRIALPAYLSESMGTRIDIMLKGKGVAYVDGVQMEKGSFANDYNLLCDGSFELQNSDWSGNNISVVSSDSFESEKALKISGDLNSSRFAVQEVTVKSEQGTRESFTLSGWAKGNSVPKKEREGKEDAVFEISAEICYKDGETEKHSAEFVAGVRDWQFASVDFSKEKFKAVDKIKVYCDYSYNFSSALFDNLTLVRNGAEFDLNSSDFYDNVESEEEEAETFNETNEILPEEFSAPQFEEVTDGRGNTLTETTFFDGELGTIYRSFEYSFDAHCDLERETDARGNTTSYTVDKTTSRNEEITDRCGNKTAYEYDERGKTKKVTSKKADGTELSNVSYSYDAFDNLSEIVRGDGLKYNLAYNPFHNLESIAVNGKAENLVTYHYKNGNGRLKEIVYANGDKMKATYNSLGYMIGEKWYNSADVLTAHYKYVYDGDGNIVRSFDILALKEYNYYYENGSLIRSCEFDITLDNNEFVSSKSLVLSTTYYYDSEGTLEKKIVSSKDGLDQHFFYEKGEKGDTVLKIKLGDSQIMSHSKTDSFGRKVFDEIQGGATAISREFSYHEGEITEKHVENNKIKSAPTTQLVREIAYSDGRTISYEYDNEERITKVTDSVDGITEYTYDALGQLLTETVNGTVVNSMTYEKYYGNITTKNGIRYEYDNVWKDLLTKVGEDTISYDAQGNPVSYLGDTLTWEKGRQLKSYIKDDKNISFEYNANGIRTSKTVNGVKHSYVLDGTKILQINCEQNYILEPIYDNADNVCGMYYNSEPFYFQKNLQGDIIAISNYWGEIVARYTYDAWGKIVSVTGSRTDIANANPFRYRGYYYDTEIGLYYVSSRYYDPEIGRFLNSDEAIMLFLGQEEILGNNLFSYCENCPTTNVDLWGYVKINIKWLGTAIDLIIWLIPALFAISKIWKTVSKSASKLVSFGNKLISVGKQLFKRFDDRLYCAFAKESTYRIVRTIGVLAGIITIISSIGSIVQYIIDILDGKWDGYLNTNRFGPKLDLTRDY